MSSNEDAADDLDAFFDDVDKAADEAVDEEKDVSKTDNKKEENVSKTDNTKEAEQPPTKKQKIEPPVIPRGVVVAAASSASYSNKKEPQTTEDIDASGIGPAFPPPNHLSHQSASTIHTPTLAGPQTQNPSASAASMPNRQLQQQQQQPSQKKHTHLRTAGGKTWVDTSLEDWPDDDFRIFVGNLGNEVTDQMLYQHFAKFSSMQRAKVVRDNKQNYKNQNNNSQHDQQSHYQPQQQQQPQGSQNSKSDSKGYGFVSFGNALECAKAIREMDQTWLGSRPIRIKRSTWKDREIKQVRKNQKKQKHHQKKMRLL